METSNGGVTVDIPQNYNAEFETRTVNGGLNIDFPITVQGELTSRRGITTTLGSGGPPVRVRTTNGGVRVTSGVSAQRSSGVCGDASFTFAA